MFDFSGDFLIKILYASLIDTIIVYGLLETLKKIFIKFFLVDKSSRYVGILLTYIFGFFCTIFFQFNIENILIQGLTGVVIGCLATAMYKSAVKQLLGIPEKLVNRIFDED